MSRIRLPFLPTFLTLLGVAFAVVLVARIRTYHGGGASVWGGPGEVSSTISGEKTVTRRLEERSDDTTTEAVAAGRRADGRPVAGATQREQRYRELLNAPPGGPAVTTTGTGGTVWQQRPPVAPPVKPVEKSALAKIGDAIKKVFSPSSAPPPPMSQQTGRSSTPPGPDTPREKDPSTDTTPPQVSLVQFDPPSVHDGETTSVIVTAIDDMSGVRGLSGTVTSPTGKALQGFACQRDAPESNRYIGRVTIPKDAEEGMWHINFLSISDNASNSLTLSYGQSPILQAAQLQVTSSNSDKTPPTVRAAWIDRGAMRAGEKNTLFVQAQDDKSGVSLVSGVFLSPHKQARIGVACRGGDSDIWTCDFNVPACLDCGDWTLEQIQLQDKASNMVSVTATASDVVRNVVVNIVGDQCDGEPPTLQSVQLETGVVPSTPQGTSVDVRVAVVDNGCGVASVSGQVIGPSGGSGLFFSFSAAGDPMWVGRMPIPRLAGKGIWKINWLQVMDKGNNLRVYFSSDPLLRNAFVNVR
ncbi:MAG TPA: hypothetical protein VG323_10735 [Thermoanaerobaculia bacterium]|nr:hypothetical protein [Thermoanaerobaculia bacterium]